MILAGQGRPAYFVYHALWCALDWIFPPICGGCGKLGTRWCDRCQEQVSILDGPICPLCGDPQPEEQLCQRCQEREPSFRILRSCAAFQGPLREAMHRLKYRRDIGLGEALSKHMIEYYNHLQWDVDMVTPVPLSSARGKERGYNQSSLLARPLAYSIQKPFRADALRRTRETRSQVGLSALQRQDNVTGAFRASPGLVRGKAILIIDDVTTTGSTVNACAQAFLQAGASAVYGLTLARAVLQADADDLPTSPI